MQCCRLMILWKLLARPVFRNRQHHNFDQFLDSVAMPVPRASVKASCFVNSHGIMYN